MLNDNFMLFVNIKLIKKVDMLPNIRQLIAFRNDIVLEFIKMAPPA